MDTSYWRGCYFIGGEPGYCNISTLHVHDYKTARGETRVLERQRILAASYHVTSSELPNLFEPWFPHQQTCRIRGKA